MTARQESYSKLLISASKRDSIFSTCLGKEYFWSHICMPRKDCTLFPKINTTLISRLFMVTLDKRQWPQVIFEKLRFFWGRVYNLTICKAVFFGRVYDISYRHLIFKSKVRNWPDIYHIRLESGDFLTLGHEKVPIVLSYATTFRNCKNSKIPAFFGGQNQWLLKSLMWRNSNEDSKTVLYSL